MEILYYFKERQTMMYQWQRFHIIDELSRHGCNVKIFNPLEYESIEKANEKLLEEVKKNHYDLFMTPHSHQDLFIETLLNIKKMDLKTLLICFDNLIVPYRHKKISKYFDLVWLTSRETSKMFEKWGAKTIFNPYAANPSFFKPNFTTEINTIAFIGTPYGSRVNMINSLTNNNINVSLYYSNNKNNISTNEKNSISNLIKPAFNFMRFSIGRRIILGALRQKQLGDFTLNNNDNLELNPAIDLENLSEYYSKHALSLASTAARNTGVLKNPVNIVNLRSFEIPMCGGLQICSYFDELAEYFEEDKEIIFYRTEDEFVEKTKYYLRPDNASLRMKMKKAARIRAEREHTWFRRFSRVFDYLDLKYK